MNTYTMTQVAQACYAEGIDNGTVARVLDQLEAQCQDKATMMVWDLADAHRTTWADRPWQAWFWGLVEEVAELGLSLVGLHCHGAETIEHELMQISSIALNWLRRRYKLHT